MQCAHFCPSTARAMGQVRPRFQYSFNDAPLLTRVTAAVAQYRLYYSVRCDLQSRGSRPRLHIKINEQFSILWNAIYALIHHVTVFRNVIIF